ncbi:MAG: hypothetical protein GX624_05410 [Actinobacteria bacterium]|nr:hypothetical protein [Actinomycetota bacterium]
MDRDFELEQLRQENESLQAALMTARLERRAAATELRERLSRSVTASASEQHLSRHPGLRRLVRDYFAALLQGRAPGKLGEQGRKRLRAFLPAGSPALARVRYLELGKLAASKEAPWPAGMVTKSLAVVHSLSVNEKGDRASIVVYPIHEFWAYVDDQGEVRTGEFDMQTEDAWNATMEEGPHRLTVVRRAGVWKITDDFAVGGEQDVPGMMRDGGAPRQVWRAEARRIAARTAERIPVPAGVQAIFERFLTLLNEHRYHETDALFVGGHGYRGYMFADPQGDWQYALKWIGGFDPLSEIAVASYPDIPFVVEVSGPTYENGGYDYAGGGMLGPSMWIARKSGGEWRIVGAGTGPPIGAGGFWR